MSFLLNILKWLLVAIPATACNSLLSYIQNKLAIAYRTRLTNEVLKQYLGDEQDQSKIFYKMGMSGLCGLENLCLYGLNTANLDDRIQNPDQYATFPAPHRPCSHAC